MSPEQAEDGPHHTDTRSDIYSLGVLLYETLVGTTPLDARGVREASAESLRRALLDTEPSPPSSVMTRTSQSAAAAAVRGTDPSRLRRLVRGELDCVVMKCVERDPSRRYETAGALAADLRRYLRNEPVSARPAGAWYRFRKLARRHAGAFAVAGAALALLIVAAAGTSTGMLRARRAYRAADVDRARAVEAERVALEQKVIAEAEAQRAVAFNRFVTTVLGKARPEPYGGEGVTTTVEMLDGAVGEVERQLRGEPEAQFDAYRLIGQIYANLGLLDRAESTFRQALSSPAGAAGAPQAKRLAVKVELTDVRARMIRDGSLPPMGLRAAEAARIAQDTVAEAKGVLRPDHPITWDARAAYADVVAARGAHSAAQTLYEKLLEEYDAARAAPEQRPPLTGPLPSGSRELSPAAGESPGDRRARYARSLASCLVAQQKYAPAMGVMDKTLRFGGAAAPGSLTAAGVRYDFGRIFLECNRLKEAQHQSAQSVDVLIHLLKDHPDTLRAMDANADVLEQRGEFTRALGEREELALKILSDGSGDSEANASRLYRLGVLRHHVGEPAGGDEALARAVTMRHRLKGDRDATSRGWALDRALLGGLGGRPWPCAGLRDEVWSVLRHRLIDEPPPATGSGPVNWDSLEFRLIRWRPPGPPSAAGGTSDAADAAAVIRGGLAELRGLHDPGPGLYLLALRLDTAAGRRITEAEWVLLAPWRVLLREVKDPYSRADDLWDPKWFCKPDESRSVSCLSMDSDVPAGTRGPNGRLRSFGAVAVAPLHLPPGHYRLSALVDDGLRAHVGDPQEPPAAGGVTEGLPLANAMVDLWALAGPKAAERPFDMPDRPQLLRVQYFQRDGGFRLRLRVRPEGRDADALVTRELGEESEDMRRRLVREGLAMLQGGSTSDAEQCLARAVELGRKIAGAEISPSHSEALEGLAQAAALRGDSATAASLLRDALRLRSAAVGPDHSDTLRAARDLARRLYGLPDGRAAEERARLRSQLTTRARRRALEELGQVEETLNHYPSDSLALRARAGICGRLGELQKAEESLCELLRSGETGQRDEYLLGLARLSLGDREGFEEHRRNVMSRLPEMSLKMTGVARRVIATCCLADLPQDEAKQLMQIAKYSTEQEPGSAAVARCYGMALYRAREYSKAIEQFSGIRRDPLAPPNPAAAADDAYMAMAHYQLGQHAAARAKLQAARAVLLEAFPAEEEMVFEGNWDAWRFCRLAVTEAEELMNHSQTDVGR
jgi:tetratricopeptide (TPR) repeat protein